MVVSLGEVRATPYLVRSNTGRIHIRYEVVSRTVDDGRCGIDENWERVTLEQAEGHDVDRLCRYCFPEIGD